MALALVAALVPPLSISLVLVSLHMHPWSPTPDSAEHSVGLWVEWLLMTLGAAGLGAGFAWVVFRRTISVILFQSTRRSETLQATVKEMDARMTDIHAADVAHATLLQRRLHAALVIGRIGNWEINIDTGRVWWSEECHALFGLSPAEFDPTLESVVERVHPEDRECFRRDRDRAWQTAATSDLEFRVCLPGGEIRWLNSKGNFASDELRSETGRLRIGVYQDVTERKIREQRIFMLENAINHINDLVVVFEFDSSWTDPRPVFVNRSTRQLLGSSLDEFFDRGSARHAQDAWKSVALSLGAGRPVRRTVELQDARGEDVHLDLDVLPVERSLDSADDDVALWIAVGRDVTDRTTMEARNLRLLQELQTLNRGLESQVAQRTAELAAEKAHYQVLAEHLPQMIWRYEVGKGVTYANPRGMEFLRVDPSVPSRHRYLKLIHPDDLPEVLENWKRSLETGTKFSGVRRFLDGKGGYTTTVYSGAPVTDADGKHTTWVGVDTDVTELKRIEAELRDTNQQLEAFSYSVSHDLRSPLGLIDGFATMLQRQLGDQANDKAKHCIDRIKKSTAHMSQLIDDMLALAKIARSETLIEEVDITRVANEVMDRLYASDPERKASVVIEEGLVAKADARLLRVALDNLLGNAWKFSSKSERTRIEVGRLEKSAVYFVRDNGAGFEEKYASRLFGLFERLHHQSDFPGTGIGLATVHRIITRHGGKLWAKSTVGAGSTFFFTLQAYAGDPNQHDRLLNDGE